MKKRKNFGRPPIFDHSYLGKVGLYALITVISIAAILYFGFHIAGSAKEGIDIMYARSETIPNVITGQAYIIREETPLTDTITTGYLSPVMRDGTKVKVGQRVADVYSSPSSSTRSKINLIEEQIEFYKKCKNSHLSIGDTSAIDNDIASTLIAMKRAAASGDLSYSVSAKSDFTLSIRRLSVLTGKVTDFDSQINTLSAKLESLKASLGNVNQTIYAPKSGYYFGTTDGYENVFSSANIDSVTYSDIIAMINKSKEYSENDSSTSAGKIVSSFKWYVACQMSASDAANFKINKYYNITLKNNPSEEISMKMYKLLTDATDAVVIFECSKMPENFDYTRNQIFTAVYDTSVGYRIPITAVRMHDGYQGVYILDEVTVKFRKISVIGEENGYLLCKTAESIEESEKSEALDGEISVETEQPSNNESTQETNDDPIDEVVDIKPRYYYLQENDIIIKRGTGLYVGMTYNPGRK